MSSRLTKTLVLLLLLIGLGAGLAPAGEVDEQKAAKVKAAFLIHFLKYTQWPDEVLNGDMTLKIGVIGPDPFVGNLQPICQTTKIREHALQVQMVQIPGGNDAFDSDLTVLTEMLKDFHALYINESDLQWLHGIRAATADFPILVIGETSGFAEAGGMIGLKNVDGKISFDINVNAAQDVQLKISSKLLKLANLVETKQSS